MPPGKMPLGKVPPGKLPPVNLPPRKNTPGKLPPRKITPRKIAPRLPPCPLPSPPKKKNFVKLSHVMEYFKEENFVNFNFCQSQFSWVAIFNSEEIEKKKVLLLPTM